MEVYITHRRRMRLAAEKIQAVWRGFLAREVADNLRYLRFSKHKRDVSKLA